MEVHDFWELVYIESGDALITSDDEKIPVSAGDLFFHKPGEVHAIESINGSYIRAYFISFSSASEITKLFDRLKITIRHEQKTMLKKLCDEALTLYDNKPEYEKQADFYSDKLKADTPTGAQQLFRMHFEEFLISVIRLIEEKENVFFYESKAELDAFIFRRLTEKLKKSIYSELSITELCDELGCGRTYLSILFKKNTGDTIMNYYNILKINEAKSLIEEGKLPLSEISELLHFSTRFYFSRVFKRIEGITPSEYKAKLKNNK
jgi:AraC-like DNA-binding protein